VAMTMSGLAWRLFLMIVGLKSLERRIERNLTAWDSLLTMEPTWLTSSAVGRRITTRGRGRGIPGSISERSTSYCDVPGAFLAASASAAFRSTSRASSFLRWLIRGRRYARVFPDPVSAAMRKDFGSFGGSFETSWPSSAGIVNRCTGVGL